MFVNQEYKKVFDAFDKDHSGSIDFDEFLTSMRVSRWDLRMMNFVASASNISE